MHPNLFRARMAAISTVLVACLFVPASGQGPPAAPSQTASAFPGADWERIAKPESVGFSSARLEGLRGWLGSIDTTAMFVSVGGRVLFEYGDVKHVSYLASVRKSVLAMLYGKYVENGTIKLDPSKNPKWVDSTDAAKGAVSLGIYEFTEEGNRRVCFGPPGKPRPTEFSSKPGSGHSYLIWKRADADAIQGVFTMLSGEVKGERLSEQTVKTAKLVLEGNKHTVHVGDDVIVGTSRMDSGKNPKEIDSTDLRLSFCRDPGRSADGIYP